MQDYYRSDDDDDDDDDEEEEEEEEEEEICNCYLMPFDRLLDNPKYIHKTNGLVCKI